MTMTLPCVTMIHLGSAMHDHDMNMDDHGTIMDDHGLTIHDFG